MKSILLMFSGGLDSLAALYLLLTDPKYAEYSIHVHHVEIVNKEWRHLAERIAVQSIFKYLKDNKYKDFDYSESSITVPAIGNNFLWDTDITSFISGYMSLYGNHTIAFGVNKDDLTRVNSRQMMRAASLFGSFSDPKRKLYPVSHLTKQELYDLLPKELSELSWSCRTPVLENNIWTKCKKCHTCIRLSLLRMVDYKPNT